MNNEHDILINELVKLLKGGSAHAGLDAALDGLPANLRGIKPHGLPYSIWQLVEHIRLAQWDMLQFSIDGNHQSPKWPEGYWVAESEPASNEAWERSLKQIHDDLHTFIKLIKHENIYHGIPHGSGQTILREALQIADHLSYHVAEIIVIRRLLGAWH